MSASTLTIILLALTSLLYTKGYRKAVVLRLQAGPRTMHSQPFYHGALAAAAVLLPALILLLSWQALEPKVLTLMTINSLPEEMRRLPEARLDLLINSIKNLAAESNFTGSAAPALLEAARYLRHLQGLSATLQNWVSIIFSLACGTAVLRAVSLQFRARHLLESLLRALLFMAAALAVLTTVGIVFSVLFEALRFFEQIGPLDFLFGLHWSPQAAVDGSPGKFGAIPIVAGTVMISTIAMAVATPIGLMAAIYLCEYAAPRNQAIAKPLIEILAGIPTVVYGFFAAVIAAPAIRLLGETAGLTVSSESALAAGLVMGVMIIPFIMSIANDALAAVPHNLREGSYALGATKSETICHILLPAALPGIIGGILLAVSRAIGETMIVVMAAGLSAKLTANPLEAVTTVTVQIVTLLVGDQEFDSPKTLAAFALGLLLFVLTMLLNISALYIVRRYRERYE